jgi:hypothetical protein
MPVESSPRPPKKKWSTASPTFSSSADDERGNQQQPAVDHQGNDSSTRPTGYNSDTESESPSGQSGQSSGHASTGGGSVTTKTSEDLGFRRRCRTTTCVRCSFFIVLLAAAAALATAIYYVLSGKEEEDFETEVRSEEWKLSNILRRHFLLTNCCMYSSLPHPVPLTIYRYNTPEKA